MSGEIDDLVDDGGKPNDVDANQSVDLKKYESAKNDMHKFKRQAQESNEQLTQLQAELEQMQNKQLETANNYKELYEKAQQKLQNVESEKTQLANSVITDKKLEAIKREAYKRGFDPDFEDLLTTFDMNDVIVERGSNGFNTVGADLWVDELLQARPKFFNRKSDPNINNNSGSNEVAEKFYSKAEVLKLQKENPAKYNDIIMNKRHLIK